MPCYYPIWGRRDAEPNQNGKFPIVFGGERGHREDEIQLACGRCMGCRLERSRQWAIRCLHECAHHEQNQFITLTYADENLPADGSVSLRDWQLFIKKYRRRLAPKKIKFFMGAEYGEKLGRPHYHAIIFGHDFEDKEKIREDPHPLYTSKTLEKIWGKGLVSTGEVTFESAAYVAAYCTKKVTGDDAEEHYRQVHPSTGEIYQLTPEFGTMSNGIGWGWLNKNKRELEKGFITSRGRKMKPPKAYTRQLEKEFTSETLDRVKEKVRTMEFDPERGDLDRLRVKEKITDNHQRRKKVTLK